MHKSGDELKQKKPELAEGTGDRKDADSTVWAIKRIDVNGNVEVFEYNRCGWDGGLFELSSYIAILFDVSVAEALLRASVLGVRVYEFKDSYAAFLDPDKLKRMN